ncbi:MAG: DNA-binding protein WhiA, partial [Pseudoclavibacter sp.]|nr:DNA-binding protein WhiA [Pseudoclavibacter sp.]
MSLTADVKREIMQRRAKSTQARAAEVSSLIRFAGGLQLISNRIAVEAQLDSEALARRLARELMELYGVRPLLSRGVGRGGDNIVLRVTDNGETLARQTGLMDSRRRTVRGLPNRLTTGNREDLQAIWRGAFLAAGSLTDPGRASALEVVAPNSESAMAL